MLHSPLFYPASQRFSTFRQTCHPFHLQPFILKRISSAKFFPPLYMMDSTIFCLLFDIKWTTDSYSAKDLFEWWILYSRQIMSSAFTTHELNGVMWLYMMLCLACTIQHIHGFSPVCPNFHHHSSVHVHALSLSLSLLRAQRQPPMINSPSCSSAPTG